MCLCQSNTQKPSHLKTLENQLWRVNCAVNCTKLVNVSSTLSGPSRWLWNMLRSCSRHASCFLSSRRLRQLDSNTRGSRLQSALSVCVILCVGLWKRTSSWMNIFSLTRTITAKQQRREDDTSFILCTAVNSDDSLEEEKKNWAEEVTYMARKRERKREERECSAGSGFYLWFVYLCTSQWFPAPNPCWRFTPKEGDVPNRRKCFSPLLSGDAVSHSGQAGRHLFPPIILSRWICWHICTPHTQTHRAVCQNHS